MIFSIKDQLKFAELSQDFNPIHCDEVLARRYIFGEPVVHGINAMLFAIKEWSYLADSPFFISKLRCKFKKPLYLGTEISIEIKNFNDSIKINLIQGEEIKTALLIEANDTKHDYAKIKPHDSQTDLIPKNISFNKLIGHSGQIECSLNIPLAEKYYSADFIRKIGYEQLAEILSLSRIVGMHSPGLNSILSEVSFCKNTRKVDTISFKVKSVDDRFSIINIESSGPHYNSNIKAFYRPPEVKQRTIEEIKNNIQIDEFKHYRALIIGASRGLGELTAKCLGYGGASLQMTYSKGKKDAMKVLNDIQNYNNGNVSIFQLDVTKITDINFDAIKKFKPTHVFYFATPFIFSGSKNKFSKQKYSKFRLYYLDAFEILVKSLSKINVNTSFLYPSSIAVEEEPLDMLEYTLAKKEGEELCMKLENKYSNIKIICPRLPRFETDQTVSLSSVDNEDPIKFLEIIRLMKNKD